MKSKSVVLAMCVSSLLSISLLTEAASTEGSDTASLKALGCIADCSRMILETDLDPAKNKVVAGDQVLAMLNLLASFPGDNPLRDELAARGMAVDSKVFESYNRLISGSNVMDACSAILLPSTLSPHSVPPVLRDFGAYIQVVLDEAKTKEKAKSINDFFNSSTKGRISRVITPGELKGLSFGAITASSFKSFWCEPFEKEKPGVFNTIHGRKPVTYLSGLMKCGYKKDSSGEVVSIPLQNGTKFIVFKPSAPGTLSMFVPSMLDDVREKSIHLSLPRLNVESNINLKSILAKAGFSGVDKGFLEGTTPLDSFHQKTFLKTTRLGLEAGAITEFLFLCKTTLVVVDCPHSIALVMPLGDGTYLPLFMGYVGDPTV